MFRFNRLLWSKPSQIWSYGVALLSTASALIIARWMVLYLGVPPGVVFLCAVMLSAWYGGLGPALLATTLSALAFYYCFLAPIYSWGPKPAGIPKLLTFIVSHLVIGLLSTAQRNAKESLRSAHDDLKRTVQDLQRTNDALHAESCERKRAEQERERLLHELAHLAHLNRVSTMGEMAASLAHEIKQPITAATTNAQICLWLLEREKLEVSEMREATSAVVQSVKRAGDIIERVRSLYKKSPSQPELVDVNQVVHDIDAMLRNESWLSSVMTNLQLSESVPQVKGDRVQLQQVVMNLMLNAIEAMPGSGGELVVTTDRTDRGQVLVSVSDNGVGLPEGKEEHIFDAFFTTKTQGTGMGLAISRSIVESHGGRLWAMRNVGDGSTFCFELPRYEPRAA